MISTLFSNKNAKVVIKIEILSIGVAVSFKWNLRKCLYDYVKYFLKKFSERE
jgi:hypothetical protein